jgi:membrane protein insertase Oxa1/YidC/SpoIIIJ
MIRATTSLRYLNRCSGTTSYRVFANYRISNHVNESKSHSQFLFSSSRGYGSTTTKCDDENALSDATPAPPSFDETMSRLFLESSEKVEAVAAVAWEPTWWPSDRILLLLNYVQETTGAQLAVAIIGTTISIRVFLFPLFVKAQRNQSRMAHLTPEITALKAKMDAKGSNITQEEQAKLGAQMQSIFKKYDVHPATALIIPFVQMPIFM